MTPRRDDAWGPYESEWMRSRRRKWALRVIVAGYALSFALILVGFVLMAVDGQ